MVFQTPLHFENTGTEGADGSVWIHWNLCMRRDIALSAWCSLLACIKKEGYTKNAYGLHLAAYTTVLASVMKFVVT